MRFDGRPPSLGSLQLLGGDRRFHQIKNLWSTDDGTATGDGIAWLKGTSVALITVRWVVRDGPQGAQHPMYGVLDLDAATGTFHFVPGMEQLVGKPSITPSPTRPIAAAVYSDNPDAGSGRTLNLNGGDASSKVFALGAGQVLDLTGKGSGDGGQTLTFVLDNSVLDNFFMATPANNFRTLGLLGGSFCFPLDPG